MKKSVNTMIKVLESHVEDLRKKLNKKSEIKECRLLLSAFKEKREELNDRIRVNL